MRKLTDAEIRAFRELALAARKLRRAQRRALRLREKTEGAKAQRQGVRP